MKKKKRKRFFATYIGKQNNIRLSPIIGKVVRGVPFEVNEDIANTLKQDKNFTIKTRRK